MADTIITGGTVVTADGMMKADLAITGEKITAIAGPGELEGDKTLEANGKLVMPGVVDPHVHLSGPNTADGYETGSKAAALGGVTTLCSFAWQTREDTDWSTLSAGIEHQKEEGKHSVVDYGCHAVITSEEIEGEQLDAALAAGVPSFKLFSAYEFGVSNGGIEHAFELVAERDAVALVHTEDTTICEHRTRKQQAAGKGDATHYPDSRPMHAEAMAADDAARLAVETGVQYYGVHTSGKASVDALATFQTDKTNIRAETCTHYLALDRSLYETHGSLGIMAPPVRTADDIDALFDALAAGILGVVSTDHVAFTRAEKESDTWWEAGFGINSLQRSLPVFHHEAVVKRGFSYPFLVDVMCKRPAETFGFEGKGTLGVGTDADIVIFDPEVSQSITAKTNASVADYSVYEGKNVQGVVDTTIVRGTVVANDGEITCEAGYGEFSERTRPNWSTH